MLLQFLGTGDRGVNGGLMGFEAPELLKHAKGLEREGKTSNCGIVSRVFSNSLHLLHRLFWHY